MFRKKTVVREITHAEKTEIILDYLHSIAKPYGDSGMTVKQMIEGEIRIHSGEGPLSKPSTKHTS